MALYLTSCAATLPAVSISTATANAAEKTVLICLDCISTLLIMRGKDRSVWTKRELAYGTGGNCHLCQSPPGLCRRLAKCLNVCVALFRFAVLENIAFAPRKGNTFAASTVCDQDFSCPFG